MSDLASPGGKQLALRERKKLRKEVAHPTLLEFESPTRALISLPVPLSARIVAPLVALLVITTIAVTAVIPIDIVVTASGKLVAKGGTFVVQPLDVSIVRSIDVKEGEPVKAGQLLAKLDPTMAAADASALQSSVASLSAEMDRLTSEVADHPYIPTSAGPETQLQTAMYAQRHAQLLAQRDTYRQKIASLETQISGNLAMVTFYKQRLAVAQNVEDMRRQLENLQVGSRLNSLAAADNRLEMQRNMVSSQAAAETERQNLSEMIAERDQAEQQWFAQISQTMTDEGRKLSDAREELKKASLHHKLVELRAPQDAVVLSIARVSVGSVMQSGDQFITLVPADSPLDAQVFVQGQDAGWPQIGDSATIKFQSFIFTHYGYALGTVSLISADSFTPQDAAQPVGTLGAPNLKAPADGPSPLTYRANIAIDQVLLHDTPPEFRLMPGIPIEADIKVGKRTFLAYMLGRVMPAFSQGMREP